MWGNDETILQAFLHLKLTFLSNCIKLIHGHIELSGRRNFRLRCKIRRLSMKILK